MPSKRPNLMSRKAESIVGLNTLKQDLNTAITTAKLRIHPDYEAAIQHIDTAYEKYAQKRVQLLHRANPTYANLARGHDFTDQQQILDELDLLAKQLLTIKIQQQPAAGAAPEDQGPRFIARAFEEDDARQQFNQTMHCLRAFTFRNNSIGNDVTALLDQIAAVDAQDQISFIEPMQKLYAYFDALAALALEPGSSLIKQRLDEAHDDFVASVQPLLAHDNALVKNIGIGLLSVAGALLTATLVAIALGSAAIVVLPTAAITSLAVATVSFSAAGFGTFFGAPRIPAKLAGTASIELADKIANDEAPHTLVTSNGHWALAQR